MVDHSQSSPSTMEGFGSADVSTPFHYGSVYDGNYRSDTLEQKLKKQYWKTKQTVIQKLGKNQDEYIVAGDAEIDTKLEKAYHLQSSCTDLLQAIHKYISRLRTVSLQESVMGEHLRTWSETEYTNAGEVMQNVGKLEDRDSKSRYKMIPPLMRMHNEFTVFRDTAVRDLNNSIQSLEKGRTEYRAALLWMKDVSDKLHNPDYRDQLVRFREAQATVKDAKRRFEKLKVDLGEKIDMVAASRCNLLSRSLPNYQKEVLGYSDTVANEFHNLLVDLRTHHHHQYKVRRVLEEIRDLEADELPFNDQPGEDGDEFSSLNLPEEPQNRPLFAGGDDDSLLDLGASNKHPRAGKVGGAKDSSSADPQTTGKGGVDLEELRRRQEDKVQEPFRRVGDPFSLEEVAQQAKVKDLVLGGIEAELKALQNEVLNPRETTAGPSRPRTTQSRPTDVDSAAAQGGVGEESEGGVSDEIDELLKLSDGNDAADDQSPLSGAATGPGSGESSGQDKLVSEWDDFSSFMPATRDHTKSPLSGWEQELLDSTGAPSLDSILTPSVAPSALPPATQGPENSSKPPVADSPPTSDPLGSAASVTEPPPRLHPPNGTSTGSDKDSAPSSEMDVSVDELLGLGGGSGKSADEASSRAADELLMSELQSLGISPPKVSQSTPQGPAPVPTPQGPTPAGLASIDPALFQLHSAQSQLPPSVLPANSASGGQASPFRSPLGMSQCPPVFPTQGGMGMAMAPPKFGLVPPSGPAGGVAPTAQPQMVAKGDEGDKGQKGTAWMNFFAHLDPLVNEKA